MPHTHTHIQEEYKHITEKHILAKGTDKISLLVRQSDQRSSLIHTSVLQRMFYFQESPTTEGRMLQTSLEALHSLAGGMGGDTSLEVSAQLPLKGYSICIWCLRQTMADHYAPVGTSS